LIFLAGFTARLEAAPFQIALSNHCRDRVSFILAISSTVFLSFPQGSLVVHRFRTSGKCFSVARRNIPGQSGFSEYVAILKSCQWMIAVTPVADWQFSRVNCRGKFGNARECVPVARALRPPPQSVPERTGQLAAAGIAEK
jgi:hypothetical protein